MAAWAGDEKSTETNKTLSGVTSPELPAKAIEMVIAAKPEQQEAVTTDVVKTAVRLRPTMATAIVSAIASKSPANAAAAAASAVTVQPRQARLIVRSAVSAAPNKVSAIVKAACKAQPDVYHEIAMGASSAAPTSGKEILDAITEVLPSLKAGVDRVLAGYNGNIPSVAYVLDQAKPTPTTTGAANLAVRGPSIGAPYIPLTQTATNSPGGTPVNPGSRDYARP